MAAKKRDVSIIERRLKSGSIFSAGSRPIPLVEPKRWTLRIVNTRISDARQWEMQADKGWVYATAADIAVKPDEIGFRELDGRIVRGTQGYEVLMKMEQADYRALQTVKDAENRKQTFGTKATKAAILNAAGAEPDGARGADFLNKALQSIEVKDGRELVSLEE